MHRVVGSRVAAVGALLAGLQLLSPLGAVSALAAPATTGTGYDVSYPQCSTSLPTRPGFGVVGVNDGRAYTANPCLATQYRWAAGATSAVQPHVSFYVNTGNPGPSVSTQSASLRSFKPKAAAS